jgi:hypothetical protein
MKPFHLTPLEPLEHDIQGSILVYLAWDHRVAWAHRFNIGSHVIKGTKQDGTPSRRYVQYAFPGCADLLGQLVTGPLLAIECQRAGGYQRPEQREFLEQVRAAGGLGIFAKSIDEVRAALDRFVGSRASWAGVYPPLGTGSGAGATVRRPSAPRSGAAGEGEGQQGSGVRA